MSRNRQLLKLSHQDKNTHHMLMTTCQFTQNLILTSLLVCQISFRLTETLLAALCKNAHHEDFESTKLQALTKIRDAQNALSKFVAKTESKRGRTGIMK